MKTLEAVIKNKFHGIPTTIHAPARSFAAQCDEDEVIKSFVIWED